ncbi:MAG: squalene--hopene cyclase [Candidatus Solibacter usitatus]|nr:squalene--hopene cyclase [Candidatus Solibacter usitatus]
MMPGLQISDGLLVHAEQSARRAVEALLKMRSQEGFWCADLTADSTLESDFILLQLWMHPPEGKTWNPPTRPLIDKAVRSILARQLPDGGFNIYQQGPSEISASVKAYFSLKLAGVDCGDARMVRLRDRILAMGGLQRANSYVKINLSLFGLYPREHVPSVPPEVMLAGKLIYEMSSWTRAIVIPLSIVHASRPMKPVPEGFHIDELHAAGVSFAFPNDKGFFSWKNFFLRVDGLLKLWEKHGPKGVRRMAMRKALDWSLEHTRHSDGLAAIYPPMMYLIMALDVMGVPRDHADHLEAQRQFDRLMTERGGDAGFFFQPCFSVVWDTAIAAFSVGESNMAPPDALQSTADWLLRKEIRRPGDWCVKRPGVEPSGWYFEHANEFYPDIDDTAMVLLAMRHARASSIPDQQKAIDRAVNWLLAMQSKDGGWAAFDVDNNWGFLADVPFADHNAMLDPTCPDITGRVMEALVAHGTPPSHPAIQRGAAFLRKTQGADSSWYGRWGVDYIYGTFLALRGLRAAGESDREAHILRAGEWLRAIQNADGGWGESCESYDRNSFVAAPSTPSQTAWAVLGLLASGDQISESVRDGIEYLIETQKSDGTWDETLATGTGFPRVFYLTYHLYRNSFPALALSAFLNEKYA